MITPHVMRAANPQLKSKRSNFYAGIGFIRKKLHAFGPMLSVMMQGGFS
jgi:hypothetical protein